MRRLIPILLFALVLGTMTACAEKDEPITEVGELELLMVDLTVTNEVEVGDTVEMSALVTMGDRNIDDADEVVYEVWEEGKKSESEMIDAVNEKDGIYKAETSFDHDGVFHIQVHVTAEAQHVMPVQEVTVGHGGEYEESSEPDYHTEGFDMHFMKLADVTVGADETLTVHIEINEQPLEEAKVRYEIWHEGNPDKHDWVNVVENEAGEYSADYTFEEAEQYTIVIHVEDDEGLHEHADFVIDVK